MCGVERDKTCSLARGEDGFLGSSRPEGGPQPGASPSCPRSSQSARPAARGRTHGAGCCYCEDQVDITTEPHWRAPLPIGRFLVKLDTGIANINISFIHHPKKKIAKQSTARVE